MKKLLVALLVGALMLGWGFGARQVQAGGPATVDFSAEVTADGCETETGDTVCDVDVGATFTVTVNINSFGGLPLGGGYTALEARLDDSATGLTVQPPVNASWTWPLCIFPVGGIEQVGASTITTWCGTFVVPNPPPSVVLHRTLRRHPLPVLDHRRLPYHHPGERGRRA